VRVRVIELQSYRVTELQSYRVTELQSYRVTELELGLGLRIWLELELGLGLRLAEIRFRLNIFLNKCKVDPKKK